MLFLLHYLTICDYYDLVMVLFSKTIMVLLTIFALSQNSSSRKLSHKARKVRIRHQHHKEEQQMLTAQPTLSSVDSEDGSRIGQQIERLEYNSDSHNNLAQTDDVDFYDENDRTSGWEVKNSALENNRPTTNHNLDSLALRRLINTEDDNDGINNDNNDNANYRNSNDKNYQQDQMQPQLQHKRHHQQHRNNWAGYEHLCETTTRTVHLNNDAEEFNPPFYIEVRCKNNPKGSLQGSNGIQKCAFNLLHCVQTYTTSYFSRRTSGDSSWKPHSLVVPSGCECMWPVEEFGPLKRNDEL